MIRVGITGGMGCGKSTVVAEFRKLGRKCFVADSIAADYYNQANFLCEIRMLFGNEVFNNDGSVDKKRIASIVFNNQDALKKLNALVHPHVMYDFDIFCSQYSNEPYVLFESAILYDYGLDRMMDRVICVYLDLEERIQRLKQRDNANREQLMARISNQIATEDAMMRADYVILNYEGNPRLRQVTYFDKLLSNI